MNRRFRLAIPLRLLLMLCSFAPFTTFQTPVAFAVAPADCTTATPMGWLVLRPRATDGELPDGLLVIDPKTGAQTAMIDIPAVDQVYPTRMTGLALAQSGEYLYLVNAVDATATRIDLGGADASDLFPNPVQFRGSAGMRYLLLGSAPFDSTYLIDLQAGVATSLTNLMPGAAAGSVYIPFAMVTSDDAHVVMWDGTHVYVVDAANPIEARLVDGGKFAYAPDVSPDGTRLVFTTSDGPGSGSTLVIENIDGSDPQTLLSSDQALVTLWSPDSETVLIDERTEEGAAEGSISLLEVTSGDEIPVLDYEGSVISFQFDDSGKFALMDIESQDGSSWYQADLDTGDYKKLDLLSGGQMLPGLYADTRWALVIPSARGSNPLDGPAYRMVDLETGAVSRLLDQSAGSTYLPSPVISPDSQFALVTEYGKDMATLWLLDGVELRTRQLAIGRDVSGQFSPDGCFVAATVSFDQGSRVKIASVAGTQIASVPSAVFGAWV